MENILYLNLTEEHFQRILYASDILNAVKPCNTINQKISIPDSDKYLVAIEYDTLDTVFSLGVLVGRKMMQDKKEKAGG